MRERERESASRFTRYDLRNRREGEGDGSSNHSVVITRRALPQEIFKGIKVNKRGMVVGPRGVRRGIDMGKRRGNRGFPVCALEPM